MSQELKQPEEYATDMARLRKRNPYAKSWVLRLERPQNKHPETGGSPWGWYEVWPLGIVVGYWGSRRDDLREVDLAAWNEQAKALESPND